MSLPPQRGVKGLSKLFWIKFEVMRLVNVLASNCWCSWTSQENMYFTLNLAHETSLWINRLFCMKLLSTSSEVTEKFWKRHFTALMVNLAFYMTRQFVSKLSRQKINADYLILTWKPQKQRLSNNNYWKKLNWAVLPLVMTNTLTKRFKLNFCLMSVFLVIYSKQAQRLTSWTKLSLYFSKTGWS